MKKINFRGQLLLCLWLLVASNTWAALGSYNSEASLISIDRDKSTVFVVRGEYYFVPVSTKEHPLAEANFFSRSASIRGVFSTSDTDFGSLNYDSESVNIHYSHAKKDSPLTFGIGYAKSNSDITDGSLLGTSKSDLYDLDIGYYFTRNSHLDLSYLSLDGTTSHPSITNTTSEFNAYSVRYKQVIEYNDNTALSLIGALTFSGSSTDVSSTVDSTIYQVIANYYFNRAFNLSGSLTSISSDSSSSEGTKYSLTMGYFITESLNLKGTYEQFDSTVGGTSNTDVFAILVNYRF